ncbi:hypothetical protein D3C78_1605860 [compost metagenome]
MSNKVLIEIVGCFQFAPQHAWNIWWDMAVTAFCADAGRIFKVNGLLIFLIYRLHRMTTDAKFRIAGQLNASVRHDDDGQSENTTDP